MGALAPDKEIDTGLMFDRKTENSIISFSVFFTVCDVEVYSWHSQVSDTQPKSPVRKQHKALPQSPASSTKAEEMIPFGDDDFKDF